MGWDGRGVCSQRPDNAASVGHHLGGVGQGSGLLHRGGRAFSVRRVWWGSETGSGVGAETRDADLGFMADAGEDWC